MKGEKRRLEIVDDDDDDAELLSSTVKKQRSKVDDKTQNSPVVKTPSSKRVRCPNCKQLEEKAISVQIPIVSEKQLCKFDAELLVNDKLRIVENAEYDADESLDIEISQFALYDKQCRHLCPIESFDMRTGAICGYVRKISLDQRDVTSIEDSIAVADLDVQTPWVFNDDGEKPLVAISSGSMLIEYFLDEPSEQYRELFLPFKEMVYVLKAVQNILTNQPDMEYDEFLQQLNEYQVPEDIGGILTEDSLLKSATFVLSHCQNLDEYRDDDEFAYLETPVLRYLKEQQGFKTWKKVNKKQNVVVERKKKEKGAQNVFATMTPIGSSIFNGTYFDDMIQSGNKLNGGGVKPKKACGKCPKCLSPNCGKCVACKNAKSKQRCANRTCTKLGEMANGGEAKLVPNSNYMFDFDEMFLQDNKQSSSSPDHTSFVCTSENFVTMELNDCTKIYRSITLKKDVMNEGDFVTLLMKFEKKNLIVKGQVRYFTENVKTNFYTTHVSVMKPASDSFFGVLADKNEYFFTGQCYDVDISRISPDNNMVYFDIPKDWKSLGGQDDTPEIPAGPFVRQWFDGETYRCYYPNVMSDSKDGKFCPDCRQKVVALEVPLPIDDVGTKEEVCLEKIIWENAPLNVDDDVLLDVDAFTFDYKKPLTKKMSSSDLNEDEYENFDPEIYPERRRKNGHIKGCNEQVADPFKIARIMEIFVKNKVARKLNEGTVAPRADQVYLRVRKLYRVGDTTRSQQLDDEYSSRRIYWSEEFADVKLDKVRGRCLALSDMDYKPMTLDTFLEGGLVRFFIDEEFDASTGSFETLGRHCQKQKRSGANKKRRLFEEKEETSFPDSLSTIDRPLRSMDLFAGCGGMSRGFHDAGIADTKWAVEFDSVAADAFKRNFPQATVYAADCNKLLEALIDGKEKFGDKALPKRVGDVELLCGGPPCQGFSGMNRFTSSEYSKFRNSLVVTFWGFVDVLRPRMVVMENVRAFVSYKQNMVLKLSLRFLQRLGYQFTFGVLQAGSYGVPQTRRRAFIIAAAPGEILPSFPSPTHCFASVGLQLSVNIDDRRFDMPPAFTDGSAPYPTVTVRDACSDLPTIKSGNDMERELKYKTRPNCYFQKMVRKDGTNVLYNHICRSVQSLNQARIDRIPRQLGADWRDLPNIALDYEYKDKNGQNKTLKINQLAYFKVGAKKNKYSVCSCNDGDVCKSGDYRQYNTLIPWCLPHTADRHSHWAGLYGRLGWDGFFSTVVTNPEPMGKQGRVVHPDENRIVSVREHARAQGFPDCHRFVGDTQRKYRQVGNAVPPPLARAIGREILSCVAATEKKES